MSLPTPFQYPLNAHTHKHAPSGYADYPRYKPWLRDEFVFRCFYCLTRETWSSSVSGHSDMGVDHFKPKSVIPSLTNEYKNLIYVCNDCNRYKLAEELPFNPLETPLGNHLSINENGEISASTPQGQEFIDLLNLDVSGRNQLRKDRLRILRLKESLPDNPDVDAVFRRAFGYPADLPDLSGLIPPGGNANTGSENKSFNALRARGELPEVY